MVRFVEPVIWQVTFFTLPKQDLKGTPKGASRHAL